MFDFINKGFLNLLRNKGRTLLTVIGISIGIFSVVIISTIGEIGRFTINEQMEMMGLDSIIVQASKSSGGSLSDEDLSAIKEIKNVENAMPLIYHIGESEIISDYSETMIWGVNEDADEIISLEVVYGRLIDKIDLSTEGKVCVVDESVALSSYKRGNIVGKTINIYAEGKSEEFTVIGVVRNGVNMLQSLFTGVIPNFIYIPHTTASEVFGQDYYNTIAVKIENGGDSEVVATMIEEKVLSEYKDDEITVENLLKQKDQLESILSIITTVLSGIAAISLFVSGISIMTVMLSSVNERKREIGIKKAIGASSFIILKEFLIEAIFLTLSGGILGTLGAIFLAVGGSYILNITPIINMNIMMIALCVSVAIGLIFGVYPAFKAAKLPPVEALRSAT